MIRWLASEAGIPEGAAFQIVEYLAEGKRILGEIPSQDTLVLERFFDDAGGMQLVLHAPFGSRVNRAWGLALRKRFCRQFNFELQAAATHEGVLLSLGPQHSFPLEDVFRYLHPDSVREILVQALLDAPMFQVRWRWAAHLSLALLRWRGGSRTPPQIQRMEAEDLLSAVFPDANACIETIVGDREVPDHPLVRQAIDDCLDEMMDIERLTKILRGIHDGEIRCIARDTPEPSTFSHELLTARPYAFLDEAGLEERRVRAVVSRRALEPSSAKDLGALDEAAIDRVRLEAWPEAENADELHDALLVCGFLSQEEVARGGPAWSAYLEELIGGGRVQRATRSTGNGTEGRVLWVATERIAEVGALDRPNDRPAAIRELLRGRLEIVGPTTPLELAVSLGVSEAEADMALHELEGQGFVLRGSFTPGREEREWCERRLLARIHRYTLNRLRAEIEPVTPADFMRFLFRWQRASHGDQVSGVDGLAAILAGLDGFELPAVGWEPDVLAARCDEYTPELLDQLCLTGRVMWGRLRPPVNGGAGLQTTGPLRSSPVSLFLRENAEAWLRIANGHPEPGLSEAASRVNDTLERRGASFFDELVAESGLLRTQVESALGELAAFGYVTSDGFAGLRALLTPSERRKPFDGSVRRRRRKSVPYGVDTAGRWSLLRSGRSEPSIDPAPTDRRRPLEPEWLEKLAWTLLRRYGVVFRKLLAREVLSVPWRELLMAYRRLEARGEIRGGRFVTGFSGEQFALPEAVGSLRKTRSSERNARLVVISAADPLNLTGIVTPGDRITALASNRVGYRDGVPEYAIEAGEIRTLDPRAGEIHQEVRNAMSRGRVIPALRGYVGNRV